MAQYIKANHVSGQIIISAVNDVLGYDSVRATIALDCDTAIDKDTTNNLVGLIADNGIQYYLDFDNTRVFNNGVEESIANLDALEAWAAGHKSTACASGGDGLAAVQGDTNPFLGGNLNTNNYFIVSTGGLTKHVRFLSSGSILGTLGASDNSAAFAVLNSGSNPVFSVSGNGTGYLAGDLAIDGTVDGRDVAADGTEWDDFKALVSLPSGTSLSVIASPASADQVLVVDADGNLGYIAYSSFSGGGGGISSVSEDTAPVLGGNLDVNGFYLVSTGTLLDHIGFVSAGSILGQLGANNAGASFAISNLAETTVFSVDGSGAAAILGNLSVGGTVDGRDVAADGTEWDDFKTLVSLPAGDTLSEIASPAATDQILVVDADGTLGFIPYEDLGPVEAFNVLSATATQLETESNWSFDNLYIGSAIDPADLVAGKRHVHSTDAKVTFECFPDTADYWIRTTGRDRAVWPFKLGLETEDPTESTTTPKLTIYADEDFEIKDVRVGCVVAPVGQNAIIDIHVNGTSIFGGGTKAVITAASNTGSQSTIATTSVSQGDKLEFFIDQAGSSTVGQGYYATLKVHIK